MTFVSYAQNFEDVLLWRALAHVVNGFYIDVGAAHPDTDSVTRAFYDRGWTGINIEPTAAYGLRLAAARPRDTNLQIAIGERPGRTPLYIVDGTGLSTIEKTSLEPIRNANIGFRTSDVEVETLAQVCRDYAADTIHFLKIDVEGAERAVLAGADFQSFRPWIVLVEATAPMSNNEIHSEWEFILLEAGYRFVWFDGLNRFYLSEETFGSLQHAFRTPPNIFDDFIRAADTELARRIYESETRAAALHDQLVPAENRIAQLLERAISAEGRANYEAVAAASARMRGDELSREVAHLQRELQSESTTRQTAEQQALADAQHAVFEAERSKINEKRQLEAVAAFEAMRNSNSWRVTAPLRRLRSKRNSSGPTITQAPAPPREESPAKPIVPNASPPPVQTRPADTRPRPPYRNTVHQFHPGSATGDAITNSMLLTRRRLRDLGYQSEIFVISRDPALTRELRLASELPRHPHYVLILRHSMGFEGLEEILSLSAPKVLLYHNITPPAMLQGDEYLQHYAAVGREQLGRLRDHVCGSLADSEYNALELRTMGFSPVQVCNTLFDIDVLLARAAASGQDDGDRDRFTILFVGRVIRSKGQTELVDAFAAFRIRYGRPCRLVLVGRHGGAEDHYVQAIETRLDTYGLRDDVILTGLVSDDELHAWYSAADLYLSLSLHEGFGVPLVEAMAHGLPVLARSAGAVPYTLSGSGGVLDDDTVDGIVDRILEVAQSDACRCGLIARQAPALQRFRWDSQKPIFLQALVAAGAIPPVTRESHDAIAKSMQITITGHVNGSYSLAAVNRTLALTFESFRPGSVRVVPVEGAPTTVLSGVPQSERAQIETLVTRQAPLTGPHVVISQHYPVYVPSELADMTLAFFFWEESIVPPDTIKGLNANFKAVLAPTQFVAKALIDSGLSIPIRVVGFAPRLETFLKIAHEKTSRAKGPFTFLHISSGFPRKGIDVLLEAFRRAFRREDQVVLMVKVFPNPLNDIAGQIAALQAKDPDAAEIRLIDEDMPESAVGELYRQVDAIVLPARGEGYNLPAAEAMAAGLPLIVTGFGGHMDFCDESVRLIDYHFASSGSHLAVAGSLWVEPDVDDLARALCETIRNETPPASSRLLTNPASFTRNVITAVADLLLSPPRLPLRIGWISSWGVKCGIAEYSRHLINAMLSSDVDDEIIVFSDTRQPIDTGISSSHVTTRQCWDLGLINEAEQLVRTLCEIDPDVLVIQHQPGLISWNALAVLLLEAGVAHRPVILVLHTTQRILDIPEKERESLLEALMGVTRIVVHTIHDINRLKRLSLISNVTMIPQGGVGRDAQLVKIIDPISNRSAVVGCYGFFLSEKGILTLVQAIARLRMEGNRVTLRLVNADYGAEESTIEIARCRAAAETAGIADAIEWHTEFLSNEDSMLLLRGCDLIVLPYRVSKEGSSAALRMALSSGTPVAVTPIAIFDEAEQAVFRFRGLDAKDLAEGIATLLASATLRENLYSEAELWLSQRKWSVIADRFHGMLRGLHVNMPSTGERSDEQGGSERVPAQDSGGTSAHQFHPHCIDAFSRSPSGGPCH